MTGASTAPPSPRSPLPATAGSLALLLLLLGALVPFWWLLPGLTLSALWLRRGEPLGELVTTGVPVGIAVALACASMTAVLPLPLTPMLAALALVGGLAMSLSAARGRVRFEGGGASLPAASREAGIAALLLASGVVLYAWPLQSLLAPSGVDMTMHMMLARLVHVHDGIPTDQSPIYPGVPLAPYPLGFHALVSLTAIGQTGLLRAGVLVVALVHSLVPWCLYLACRRRSGDGSAAVAALLVALLARNPQGYVGWGGNPCVLGIVMGLRALRLLWDLRTPAPRRRTVARVVEAGLCAVAVPLSHPTPALLVGYVAVAGTLGVGLGCALGTRRADLRAHLRAWAHWVARLVAAAGVAALFLAPQLPAWRLQTVSSREREWVLQFHRAEPHWDHLLIAGSNRYAVAMFGDVLLLMTAAVGVTLVVVRRRRSARTLAWLLLLPGLEVLAALGAQGRIPPAFAVYPERLMPFALLGVVVPLSVALAALGSWRAASGPLRLHAAAPGARTRGAVALAVLLPLAGLAVARHQAHYVRGARNNALLTPADLLAMQWIDAHTPAGALVDTNYGDGGAYVPAAIGRPITRPQTNSVWFDEMEQAMREVPVCARLQGARRVTGNESIAPLLGPGAVRFTGGSADGVAVVDTLGTGTPRGLSPMW